MRRLTPADGEAAILGGSLLGGGGGGDPGWGRRLSEMAFAAGPVDLAGPDELPQDGLVVTAALVGAPAAPGAAVAPEDYLTALRMVAGHCGRAVTAVITNENGGLATVNGWYQAAALGVPVLDCPGNGRAHPTGVMGSLDLDLDPGYVAVQACSGGAPPGLAMLVSGNLTACARLIRQASVEAGGLVAVARNPATVSHVAVNGARGAISHAIAVGEAMLRAADPFERLQAACTALGAGASAAVCSLAGMDLATAGGFDTGEVLLDDERGRRWRLQFWNEYVLAECDGRAVAAFPDLVSTVDLESGLPASTSAVARLRAGHPLGVLLAPRSALRLGRTMWREDLLAEVARATGRGSLPVPGPTEERDGRQCSSR